MYHFTKKFLKEKGYRRYEISNYALPGRECIHNEGYWIGVDYLGLGLGATSLLEGERFSVTRSLDAYLALGAEELARGAQYESRERLSVQERMEEFMFLGLRLTDGVSAEKFEKRFGCMIESVYGQAFSALLEDGLLELSGSGNERRYRMTERGMDVSNRVLAEFLL